MKSKYELTISTNYVPDWTFIEAFRELVQNALDNQIENPENEMGFNFDIESGEVKISNKTSILEVETLLLGSTTKSDNENTIGQHGEGYKIAFMVLLREGKTIKVLNYGKREKWTVRLVKARRYNNNLVPTVEIEKEAFWKSVPDNDLTIIVGGVTQEEYKMIVEKNLNLRDEINCFTVPNMGRILKDEGEKGNIYVKGLFVCNMKNLHFGYDFEPRLIELDRDRKLVKEFDVAWQTSGMFKYAYGNGFDKKDIRDMIVNGARDTQYIRGRIAIPADGDEFKSYDTDQLLAEELAIDFIDQHGENSVPVTDNRELELVKQNNSKPIIVNESLASYISRATSVVVKKVPQEQTVREQFQDFLNEIEHKLTDEELERFTRLINKL
ncbi:MAG: hypothetical protein PHH48_08975 [Eubacteriales bacterium]|nr:hypothetical protein [Eubacteriales bacterium]